MSLRFPLFVLLSLFPILPAGWAAPGAAGLSAIGDDRWVGIRDSFEGKVGEHSEELDRLLEEKEKLGGGIRELEDRILALRGRAVGGLNVIDEIRLKGFLNNLRDKLERESELKRRLEEVRRDFEQTALSLVALYNERVERAVEGPAASEPAALDRRLSDLEDLIRRRARIQALLRKYGRKDDQRSYPSLASVENLKQDDRESLQMTLDHLRDRRKDLEEGLEKAALEEQELLEEMRLQAKMQDFLEGIRRLNEDSDVPRDAPRRDELERMVGKGQKGRLARRLEELRARMERDRKVLLRVGDLMGRLQGRLDVLGKETRP